MVDDASVSSESEDESDDGDDDNDGDDDDDNNEDDDDDGNNGDDGDGNCFEYYSEIQPTPLRLCFALIILCHGFCCLYILLIWGICTFARLCIAIWCIVFRYSLLRCLRAIFVIARYCIRVCAILDEF